MVKLTTSVQRRPSRSRQRFARDLRQVELDGRVQVVDGVVHLAQLLGQLQVVAADHVDHAAQHGLDHVGLVQRLARRAGNGQRRRGQRHRVQVAGPALRRRRCRRDHPVFEPAREQPGQADERHRQRHVEQQVEGHHLLRHGRKMLLQQRTRLRQPGHGEQAAGQLEDQVAHRQAARGNVRTRGGQHAQHAAADIGAEHQAQRHARRQHAGAGQRGREQHDGQRRIGQHRQHRADHDVQQHLVRQRGQQLAHRRRVDQRPRCGHDQLQRQRDQPDADDDAPEAADRCGLAADEQHHADEDQQRRQPRQVEGEHHHHRTGADVGAQHHRQRRRRGERARGRRRTRRSARWPCSTAPAWSPQSRPAAPGSGCRHCAR